MTNNTIIPGFDDDRQDNLKITIQKVSDVKNCLLIVLNGYIDTYNSLFFQNQVQKAIEAGFIQLIFHCGGLSHVSSAGIGSLSVFLKTIKLKGGDLVLLSVQPKVQEVFQLLGFSPIFTMKNSLEESIGFFRNKPAENKAEPSPKIVSCPICPKKFQIVKSGRFRCSGCKTILAVDDDGMISLG